ncbi:23S rRNA (uracil(1939)-C(5))-methyltransferase RlmD [Candidatus Gracilibacteria bacterium]|nr:MAG: 23S rRNA (uracil(1939)-C(5))-methyltransferase RlmD [Candidatus Gracilibacteria bacterium]
MKKGEIIKNVEIEKLVFGGKGFAKLKSENIDDNGKTIFITGGAIPGSIVNLKVLKKRKDYLETQIVDIIKKSNIEKKHPNNIYGECGGCKWVNIPYENQLEIKENQVKESFFHIKKFQEDINIQSIIPSPIIDGYRNKVEFSFGKYISHKENKQEHFNVGFHKQGSFSQIEDFDGCILTDELTNKIYKEIKDFAKQSGLPVYDQKPQIGFFRHILIRRTFFSNEIMIVLGYNPDYNEGKYELNKIQDFLKNLPNKYNEIKSIYLSPNGNKADVAIGELDLIYGTKSIKENLLGLNFDISPKSFFQTNSLGADKLYSKVIELANKEKLKDYTVLDLYAGTGTIGMFFSNLGAKKVYSIELSTQASEDGKKNAKTNSLNNIEFINSKVEDFLTKYLEEKKKADLLIIDPPRAGINPKALPNILKFKTNQIIYVSCNPATLSRDLGFIIQNSDYKIETVVPVDMFPHTHHIETIVSLIRK